MTAAFAYTGIRVRDLDRAVDFFTRVLGMDLQGRHKADWTKGEFAILRSDGAKHWLELNWYPADSPIEGPYREGDELDHLGFEVDDVPGLLMRLKREGYEPEHRYTGGGWQIAFVPVVDGIWLDCSTARRGGARRRRPRRSVRGPRGGAEEAHDFAVAVGRSNRTRSW